MVKVFQDVIVAERIEKGGPYASKTWYKFEQSCCVLCESYASWMLGVTIPQSVGAGWIKIDAVPGVVGSSYLSTAG
jgi:hypothetical protein